MTLSVPVEHGSTIDAVPRVGPNAITQMRTVLCERLGEETARRVFCQAGLERDFAVPPSEMVREQTAADLFQTVFRELPRPIADDIAGQAGQRTAGYILAHRIPRLAQIALRRLPIFLARPMLLSAIARNAWTFAGSGEVSVKRSAPCTIEIRQNPLAVPGCVWHVAVFQTLFRTLVVSDISVEQTQCCSEGSDVCCFELKRGSLNDGS